MALRRFLALAVLLLLPWRNAQADESCVTCHPDVKTKYDASVHRRQFGCTSCHGGDPSLVSLDAHSVEHGYTGRTNRGDIPALCATCHADPKRMKTSDLPTDQYAQYQTSEHGSRLAQGDTRVAVCTDCHGTHLILSSDQPTSPVARQNVAATCGHCHSNRALMAQYDLLADQEQTYRHSVHGVALYVAGHPRAPTCATCHGSHGAAIWGAATAAPACGHCHARTRGYFNQSPHGRAAALGKMTDCISCHGYHDTTPPDRTLFDTACRGCHSEKSNAFATGQKLKTLLSRASESLDGTAQELAQAQSQFPILARHRAHLQQGRAYFMQALPVQHALAVDEVEDLTRSARSIAEDVRASVHGVAHESRVRYIELAVVWIFILFTVAVASAYRRERKRSRGDLGPEAQ